MSSSLQESELIAILNSLGSIAGHSNEQKQSVDDELVNKLKYDRVFVTNKPMQRTYFDDSDIDDDDVDDDDSGGGGERNVMGSTVRNSQRIEKEWNNMDKQRISDINLSEEDYESNSSDSDYYPQNRRFRKKKAPKASNSKKAIIKGKKKESSKEVVRNSLKSNRSSIVKKVLVIIIIIILNYMINQFTLLLLEK